MLAFGPYPSNPFLSIYLCNYHLNVVIISASPASVMVTDTQNCQVTRRILQVQTIICKSRLGQSKSQLHDCPLSDKELPLLMACLTPGAFPYPITCRYSLIDNQSLANIPFAITNHLHLLLSSLSSNFPFHNPPLFKLDDFPFLGAPLFLLARA